MAQHPVGPIDGAMLILETGRALHGAYGILDLEQKHKLHGILAHALVEAAALLQEVQDRDLASRHITQARESH